MSRHWILFFSACLACNGKPDDTDSDADTDTDTDTAVSDPDQNGFGDLVLISTRGEWAGSDAWLFGEEGTRSALGVFPAEPLYAENPAECFFGHKPCVRAWPEPGEWLEGDASDVERYTYVEIQHNGVLDMGEHAAFGGVPLASWNPVNDFVAWIPDDHPPAWQKGDLAGVVLDADSVIGAYEGTADLALPDPMALLSPELVPFERASDGVLTLDWEPGELGDMLLTVYWALPLNEHEWDYVWRMTTLPDDGHYELNLSDFPLADLAAKHDQDQVILVVQLGRQTRSILTVDDFPIHLSARSEIVLQGDVIIP